MVDMATYQLMHPTPHPPGRPAMRDGGQSQDPAGFDPWPQKICKTEEIPEKAVMLLPGTVFGFRFQVKKWSKKVASPCWAKEYTIVYAMFELIITRQLAC